MSHYVVTANLKTVVTVTYASGGNNDDLTHGKYKTQPGGQVFAGNTNQIFQVENHDGSTVPPQGAVSYTAADGTKFTFSFDDPVSDDNSCSSAISNNSGQWNVPVPQYPTGGKTWTVTYYIAQNAKTDFLDAPVFPEHLVEASKCDSFPEDRVRKIIDGKKCMYLRHAFETDELKPVNKLWCATHKIFLTPASKALLTRDLVTLATQELSSGDLSPLIDNALQSNVDALHGYASPHALASMDEVLKEKADSLKGSAKRDAEIMDVVRSLVNPDNHDGWSNAVSSYLNDAEGDTLTRRQLNVVKLIEQRL